MIFLESEKMPRQIADAFGLHPDSLELLDCEEDSPSARAFLSCEEGARKYAELAAELAECRDELERCQYQIEQLLRTKPMLDEACDRDRRPPP